MADSSTGAPIVSNRPADDAFHQQRLKMWQPILSPMNVIIIFLVVGVAFIPSGIGLLGMSNSVYEDEYVYDSLTVETGCSIKDAADPRDVPDGISCTPTFTLSKDLEGPLYVYYQLTNFYQNHRLYVKSQSVSQLLGQETTDAAKMESDCGNMLNDEVGAGLCTTPPCVMYPCGLIANSFFNDLIALNPNDGVMDETGIAWESDFEKFKQPAGFKFAEHTTPLGNTCEAYDLPNDCQTWLDPSDNLKQYKYWYPNMATTSYIFQQPQYSKSLSPIKGVQDEHLMVWMRTAALPKFRKIYGKINGPFTKGKTLSFDILSKFEVRSFDGSKSIVLSTVSPIGGKNTYIGSAFLVVGCISILLTVLFIVKHLTSDRRKLGDTNLLRWDD